MPRYFFDIRDHRGLHRDSNGIECDDAEDARKQIKTLLADIFREQMPDGDFHEIAGQVRDHDGLIIYKSQLYIRGKVHSINEVDVLVSDASG